MKRWPFPGDAPVTRARKMALAYRNTAGDLENAVTVLREAIQTIDRRLVAFDSPTTLKAISKALEDVEAVQSVRQLDRRFDEWGETWHCARPEHYDDDDLVPTTVAAQIIHIASGSILRLRQDRRIEGHWNPHIGSKGGWMFKVSDLYRLSSTMRGRGWKTRDTTDSITDSRRRDSE